MEELRNLENQLAEAKKWLFYVDFDDFAYTNGSHREAEIEVERLEKEVEAKKAELHLA